MEYDFLYSDNHGDICNDERLADELLLAGKTQSAISKYYEVINGGHPEVRAKLAEILRSLGKYTEAGELYYFYAKEYYNKKYFRKAIYLADMTLVCNPQKVEAKNILLQSLRIGADVHGQEYRRYPEYRDAKEAGAILGGWIPQYLGENIYDIHDLHDTVTREGWMVCHAMIDSLRFNVANMYELMTDNIREVIIMGCQEDWWPNTLKGRITDYNSNILSIYSTNRLLNSDGLIEYIALDKAVMKLYIWRHMPLHAKPELLW